MAVDEPLKIKRGVSIPVAEVELRTSRSSGPGGQHANVTESRVEAVFDVASSASLTDSQKARLLEQLGPVVTAVAQDARSQARNRELALERLRDRLAGALVEPKKRKPTRPSRAARERRAEEKRRRAQKKQARQRPDPDS